MKINQFHLLASQRFLPLFITQFLNAFNANAFKNALVIFIIYQLPELSPYNSQLLVTITIGIFILPCFLFSTIAGQLADKYEKTKLMQIIRFFEIFIMLLAAFGFYFGNIYILLLILFLIGMEMAFFGPVKYAILPENLHQEELIGANALLEAATFISILCGTIAGGTLILLLHGRFLISIILLFFSIIGFVSALFIPKTFYFTSTIKLHFNLFKETFRILAYSKQQHHIFVCILGISWFWLVGAIFLGEFPAFTKHLLHVEGNVVTFFLSLFSIGIAIGSLFCNRFFREQIHVRYVPLAAFGMSLFIIDLYFPASHPIIFKYDQLTTLKQFLETFSGWRITIDLLMISIFGGIYTVPLYAYLQIYSEHSHRARVIASNNIINSLFIVVGSLIAIVMLKMQFTVREIFLLVGIGNLVIASYLWRQNKIGLKLRES